MLINSKTIVVGAVVAVGLFFFVRAQAVQTAETVGAAVNPLSEENIFNKGASRLADKLSGDGEVKQLGARIYEFFNK